MPKSNFQDGKNYSQLLVASLLVYPKLKWQLTVKEKFTIDRRKYQNTYGLLVKAKTETLIELIEIYISSPHLITSQKAIAQKFINLSPPKKQEKVKNAIQCLCQLNLAIDRRGKDANTTERDFFLPLNNTYLVHSDIQNTLIWLDKSWEDAKSQPPLNLKDYQDLLQSVMSLTQLFPKELYDYTGDRLASLQVVTPTLEITFKQFNYLDFSQLHKIFFSLVRFYVANGKLKETQSLLKLGDRFGKSREIKAFCQHYLGIVYYQQKDYSQAETCLKKAIDISRLENLSHQMGDSIHNLGIVYLAMKKFSQAETCFKIALKLRKTENLERVNSLNGLADAMSAQNCLDEAFNYYKDAETILIEFTKAKLIKFHPLLASCKIGQGHILAKQGRYENAKSLYLEAIGILEHCHGYQHQELAKPKAALGAIYLCCGDTEEGQKLYNEAIQILRDTSGDDDQNIALYKLDLSTISFC